MHNDTAHLLQNGRDYLVPVYRQRELILDRGEGSRVWDSDGRDYIDFAAIRGEPFTEEQKARLLSVKAAPEPKQEPEVAAAADDGWDESTKGE